MRLDVVCQMSCVAGTLYLTCQAAACHTWYTGLWGHAFVAVCATRLGLPLRCAK